MLYSTSSQALQLPLMILTGMLIGGVSLVFRGIRRLICAGIWLSLICDILMGAVWAVIFCAGITVADSGRLRLFHVLAAAAGAAMFNAAFSAPVCRICRAACLLPEKLSGFFKGSRFLRAIFK